MRGFRINSNYSRSYKFQQTKNDKQIVHVTVEKINNSQNFSVKIAQSDGKPSEFICTVEESGLNSIVSTINNSKTRSNIIQVKDQLHIFLNGKKEILYLPLPSYATSESHSEGTVVTPMPCKISAVYIKAGGKVKKNQSLFVLEAMKMEVITEYLF